MHYNLAYLLPILITASLIICAVVIIRLSFYLSVIRDEIIKSNEIQTRMLNILKEISMSEKEKESTLEPKIKSEDE